MILKTLYKANKNKIQEWSIEVLEDSYRSIEGFLDGKMTTSKWTKATGKNIGKRNEVTPEQQAVKQAQAKVEKKLNDYYFENVNDIYTQREFLPMLAHLFEKNKKKVKFPCFEQPKLDGMRCLTEDRGMFSRERKTIYGAPHIRQALQPLFDKYPDAIVDGELYNHALKDDFNTIISHVRKISPTDSDLYESKKVIEYHVYDIVFNKNSETNFEGRSFDLAYLETLNLPGIIIVKTNKCEDQEDLDFMYTEHLLNGYEGQMVRNNALYCQDRTTDLLKRKEMLDREFKIVDITEGFGNRSEMMGRIICYIPEIDDTFEANALGNHDYYKELLDNKDQYIGKSATVKYQNLTPKGKPRFGIVTKIAREDYE